MQIPRKPGSRQAGRQAQRSEGSPWTAAQASTEPAEKSSRACRGDWKIDDEVCIICRQETPEFEEECKVLTSGHQEQKKAGEVTAEKRVCVRYGEYSGEKLHCQNCVMACRPTCIEETARRVAERERLAEEERSQNMQKLRAEREAGLRANVEYCEMLEHLKAEAMKRFGRDLYSIGFRNRLTLPHCLKYYNGSSGTCSGHLQLTDANVPGFTCQWLAECKEKKGEGNDV